MVHPKIFPLQLHRKGHKRFLTDTADEKRPMDDIYDLPFPIPNPTIRSKILILSFLVADQCDGIIEGIYSLYFSADNSLK